MKVKKLIGALFLARSYPMEQIDSYTKDNCFYFDYRIKEIPDRDVTAASLEATTPNSGFGSAYFEEIEEVAISG